MVNFEVKERIGYITINRPEKKNALNDDVVRELTKAFIEAEQNNEVKIILRNQYQSFYLVLFEVKKNFKLEDAPEILKNSGFQFYLEKFETYILQYFRCVPQL